MVNTITLKKLRPGLPEVVKRIIKAKKEIAEGKTISLEDLRKRIEKVNV